jgi:2'-5' RNA ligase
MLILSYLAMRSLVDHEFLGQRLHEYLLVISPDNKVGKQIADIKNIFSEEYGCKNAARLKPHVTMINFLQYESTEYRILNCFEKFAKTICPFSIELNGFSSFDTHTIYAKLASSYEVANVVKAMRSKFKNLLESSESLKPKFITSPHLTIARGMTNEQYEMAWPRWKKKDFSAAFDVKQISLIKRELNPRDLLPISNYKPVQDFILGGKAREEQLTLVF